VHSSHSVSGYDIVALGTLLCLNTSIVEHLLEEFELMVRFIQFVKWSQVLLDSYITLSIQRITLVSMASHNNP